MAMLDNHEHDKPIRDFDGVIEIRSNPVPRVFALLFYGLVIWAVLFTGYYLLSGWSSEGEFAAKMEAHRLQVASFAGGEPGASAPAADPGGMRAQAEALYGQHCAVCHGASGQGGIGPALDGAEYRYGRDPESVRTSIASGRPGGMPPYAGQFSGPQIEALARFIIEDLAP